MAIPIWSGGQIKEIQLLRAFPNFSGVHYFTFSSVSGQSRDLRNFRRSNSISLRCPAWGGIHLSCNLTRTGQEQGRDKI